MSAARSLPVKLLRFPAASSKGRRRRRQSALPQVRSACVSVRQPHKHSDTLYSTAVSIELQSGAFYRQGAGGLGVGQGRGGDGRVSSWLMSLLAGGGRRPWSSSRVFFVFDLFSFGGEKRPTTAPVPSFPFCDKMSPRLA